MTVRVRTLLLVALLVLVLLGAGAAVFVWMGVYDISATRQHTAPVYKLLEFAMRRAVVARAGTVPRPVPDLAAVARVREGASHYAGHCLQCHGAPGVPPDPLAFGLRPAPANLLPAGREWQPEEIFWVVKHGIKMSGMPSWAFRLSDDQIWSVVAFVRAMPGMTVRQYAELAASLPAHEHPPSTGVSSAPRPADVEAGRRATGQYLCATCHRIPGFVSAEHDVGPPLNGIARRAFIGGVLANTPDNMVRWLKDPRAVDPLSAMPALGLSDQDARDITAFLYTLDRVAHE
jgi:mono/diheme cytochrome c family protein